jgi:GTPase SAR1 family protein
VKVISADFVTSAAAGGDAGGVPRDGIAQIAFAGRSNVGKSTLLNALVRRKLARTSAAPGKTRLANVFRVVVDGGPGGPGRWPVYFVDLPGYGYARAPRQLGTGRMPPRSWQPSRRAISRRRTPRPCSWWIPATRAWMRTSRRTSGSRRSAPRRTSWPRRSTSSRAPSGRAISGNSNGCSAIPPCRCRQQAGKEWMNCGS